MNNPSTVWNWTQPLAPLAPGNGDTSELPWQPPDYPQSVMNATCFVVEISLILESICQERYPSPYTSQSSVVFPYNSGINRNQYHHYAFGMPHTVSIRTTSRNVTSLEWCLCIGNSPKKIRNFRSVKCINGELYGENLILHDDFFYHNRDLS